MPLPTQRVRIYMHVRANGCGDRSPCMLPIDGPFGRNGMDDRRVCAVAPGAYIHSRSIDPKGRSTHTPFKSVRLPRTHPLTHIHTPPTRPSGRRRGCPWPPMGRRPRGNGAGARRPRPCPRTSRRSSPTSRSPPSCPTGRLGVRVCVCVCVCIVLGLMMGDGQARGQASSPFLVAS